MKKSLSSALAAIGAIGFLTLALQLVGCHSFPTKTEQALFTVTTNYVPVTNDVVVTNPDGTKTTNPVVHLDPRYSYLPGVGERQITEIGTQTGGLFGVGSLVGLGLGVLFGAWRWFRGSKAEAMSGTLVQEIEAIREFVKTLPNGATYDNELVNWIQKHQAEAGVLQSVIAILKEKLNKPEAKGVASEIIDVIDKLKTK